MDIPKLGKPGQRRGLGIPAVRDRRVQTAGQLVSAPIVAADFRDCAYGLRPKRGAHAAISEGQAQITGGSRNVIDADLKACGAAFPPAGVVAAVTRRTARQKLQAACRRLTAWMKPPRHLPGREFFQGLHAR